jgi:phosphoglycolate phosphatase-like HAD superfamily hydrolase
LSPDPTPTRLVLWDIDGTLVRGGPIARTVFESAIERVIGRSAAEHGVVMGGKTDPQIAHEILVALGVEHDDASSHVSTVIAHAESDLAAAAAQLRRDGHVLPGVVEVLTGLAGDPAVVQSVLTGNTAANATVKLAAFDLAELVDVDVGAFGSDDADRRMLVPVALERTRRLRGFRGGPADVVTVGDTLRDYECALAGGARCVLVATGRVSCEELRAGAPHADAVLEDLSDVDAVLAMLRP